jgi:flagellar hook protein FlgE
VSFSGNLNAGGTVATQGAQVTSEALTNADKSDATGTSALDALYNSGSATPIFADGDIITISGATRGGATIPTKTFQVFAPGSTLPDPPTASTAAGTTMGDFTAFLQNAMGIDATTGSGAGVAMNGGVLTVTGNTGTVNDLALTSSDITVTTGGTTTSPFTLTKNQSANGESVTTSFEAFDSLGNTVPINLSVVLESKNAAGGTTWRFYAQSSSTPSLDAALGNGTLTFDSSGQLQNVTNNTFDLDRTGTGATSPQPITLAFNASQGAISAYSGTTSQVTELNQDGAAMGTLQSFSVNGDGTIKGTFSNSLIRNLGQVVVATFTNPQGLVAQANNVYTQNVNSGTPAINVAGTGAAGTIVGGAIEQSNVDLSNEFINLISASTAFTASSRVLTTGNQLIQDLLSTLR